MGDDESRNSISFIGIDVSKVIDIGKLVENLDDLNRKVDDLMSARNDMYIRSLVEQCRMKYWNLYG